MDNKYLLVKVEGGNTIEESKDESESVSIGIASSTNNLYL